MKSSFVHRLRDDIAIVGWACRLPGANSVNDLWSLLLEGHCAISRVPDDRFSLEQFGHPRRQERGKSYTWAAGVLDDIWGFDPGVFGISPREAVQIDPQQRILLQLTWEALEDAGIRPSSIANSDVGVYIGASQTDYGHAFFGDPAVADAHFAPGTALAILANRISYVYGIHGPSITVDTACSSSLVALNQAMEALQANRIDTAIVGGSNLIASPASFIAFSQANMLSPKGLCHAFSANADGFVRAEGAAVLILRKAAQAAAKKNPIRGIVLATEVNSDGRTNGISLPSVDAQEALLRRIYARHSIDPDLLAFVEAHGTGTPVGDPVEAAAIGRSIGQKRLHVLPIGSIKTNIGHLEPASGLAGILKAVLSLNHGILPASLHFTEPNPNIEFDQLNLSVCTQPLLLPKSSEQYAGVNSFGFGGTNAHAIVAAGRKPEVPGNACRDDITGLFAFSASSNRALTALARQYSDRAGQLSDEDTATLASAIVHRRERQSYRVVISSTCNEDVSRALNAFVSGTDDPNLMVGTAVGDEMPMAFVYSGNGGQRPGMGRRAYRNNETFRTRFDEVDGHFVQAGGWSLKDALFSQTLQERLPLTSVAQPLIFAIQCASTAALRAGGMRPAAVLGHSVGEVAAAEAAGILDLRTAVKVIHFRSIHQELIYKAGRMAAVLATEDAVRELMNEASGVELAAVNSPRAVTVAGPADALARFQQLAKERGIAVLDLDLDYPFHTALMGAVEAPLRADLRDIKGHDAETPFVSTVAGACLPGSRLDGRYWWRNVREPVQFITAVRAAAELGARYFLEIGPRPTLLKHIADSLQGIVTGYATMAALDGSEQDTDPFNQVRAKAMVTGARVDTDAIFGTDPGPSVPIPLYPWQQEKFRFQPTVESIGGAVERHPFAGARTDVDALVWRSHIDTALHPELLDHKLGEQVIFPGTGFLEIGLAVARQWLGRESVLITGFEILTPLDLTNGETREVATRVSPGSGTVEILSRPRLSSASWLLHCRFKIQAGDEPRTAAGPERHASDSVVTHAEIYNLAAASGLHYGPAFRLVDRVVHGNGLIDVELRTGGIESLFLLDPMRLDCLAHGFFTLFPELRAVERGVTYIPVRLEEVALYRPHIVAKRALIEIIGKTERFIIGNCFVYGEDGEINAILRGVRSQAVPTRRMSSLESVAFVERPQIIDGSILGQTGVDARASDIVSAAQALDMVASEAASSSEPEMLIEGWAAAAAYEIASALAVDGTVDVEDLIAQGRISENLRPWLVNILAALEAADLAKFEAASWKLITDWSLPNSTWVVKALATEQQSRAAEAQIAAAISGFAKQLSAKSDEAAAGPDMPNAALDFYHATRGASREACDALGRLFRHVDRLWPAGRALRILQIGGAPLGRSLLASPHEIALTFLEPDRRRYDAAELAFSKDQGVRVVDADHVRDLGQYDVIVAVDGLHRLPPTFGMAELKRLLAPDGLLAAIESPRSLFKDLVFGLDPDWFLPGHAGRPVSSLRPLNFWLTKLAKAGFANTLGHTIRCGADLAYLVVADAAGKARLQTQTVPAADNVSATLIVTPTRDIPLAESLRAGLSVKQSVSATLDSPTGPASVPGTVIFVPGLSGVASGPVDALTQRCLDMKSCVERIGGRSTATLWLIFSGALAAQAHGIDPVETGAWAFSRTLANEFPKLDVRRIDVARKLPADIAAKQIHQVLTSGTNETELYLDETMVKAVRVESIKRSSKREHDSNALRNRSAARLERRSAVGQRLSWQPAERMRPRAGEVEIAVEATGLNFRDLMWSLSLLPEDMLENGFSGTSLGLECAGQVTRVGASVEGLKAGDRVMAFTGSSFATHVTVKREQVVKLPRTISSEAAATIPVAFFTAYYSLVTLAKLARREWVLIHGAAGAVGMAAIQIAQSRGARIIATSGSPAKRDLLRSLGVSHVLDSRSTAFVDEVRRITGSGVDVVLNSLAGDAMERSLACLRPFGRFVELGKRDYVTNTHVGLRPFRNNLAYFGVDVDQVIGTRTAAGDRIFGKIMQQFEKGTFVPLPYSVFEADDVAEAFHLMQQSAHIGKIVVRPPAQGLPRPEKKSFQIDAEKTHIVTGAFGGFGLETAKWLVEKGACYLVMIGRRGAATPEAQSVLKDFIERGVQVIADPCDVTDRVALDQLFEVVRATMPPLAGVIHAAMVLDDAIIANLDAERFHRVLAPKVLGAENLDGLTRGQKLDYFVLFSSVTTLIGNPGQANYVAANAYMEGLARRRRQNGLPALAIGWGPIIDVGVVARNERLQSGLRKLTGVMGLRARDALALMAQALQQADDSPDTAVMTISPNEGSFSNDRLAVLRSPTYAAYLNDAHRVEGEDNSIDLHALAASEGLDAARLKVADVVSAQLAHVLHLREADISRVRPLGEIGLDSLMGLELVMNLERSFGIHIPLSGASGGLTITDIAEEIIAHVGLGRGREDAVVATLAEQHHSDVDDGHLEILKGMMDQEARAPKRLLS